MPTNKRSSRKRSRSRARAIAPLRFAHPFFNRAIEPPDHARGLRLLDHIADNLQRIPRVHGKSMMDLADVIGAQHIGAIAASGAISFHSVGDTGRSADSPQGAVADAMAADYNVADPAHSPAFFFHLGDVIYGHNKD